MLFVDVGFKKLSKTPKMKINPFSNSSIILLSVSIMLFNFSFSLQAQTKLSREKATSLIKEKIKPEVALYTYGTVSKLPKFQYDEETPLLEGAGLIKVKFLRDLPHYSDIQGQKVLISSEVLYEVSLTEEGRKYLIKEQSLKSDDPESHVLKGTFKLSDIEFKGIVYMQDVPQKGGAIVKFKISRKKTPFWILNTTPTSRALNRSFEADDQEISVLIRKTDAGWIL